MWILKFFLDKKDSDVECEKSLVDQWVCLTEERNAVLVPAAWSGKIFLIFFVKCRLMWIFNIF